LGASLPFVVIQICSMRFRVSGEAEKNTDPDGNTGLPLNPRGLEETRNQRFTTHLINTNFLRHSLALMLT
jgi:hypothetical protein